MQTDSILNEGHNCEKVGIASYASAVIDYNNYYLALHEAIILAQHSIFIIGWDIDSRIALLRGEEASEADAPVTLYELIEWKARQSPDINIYLNRWNFHLLLIEEREIFAAKRWNQLPDNVHYVEDNSVPSGASHHQKVIVIDDTIAFCGGMDIALYRWDSRAHFPEESNRLDPGDIYNTNQKKAFEPNHDAQILLSGPAVEHFAALARQRWQQATDKEAVAAHYPEKTKAIPSVWPPSVTPQFRDVKIGIALTQPETETLTGLYQNEALFFSMIEQAKRFIYIENQYLTHKGIAQALNAALHANLELRILMVSSKNPHGIAERKAFWHGRLVFMDTVCAKGVGNRVVLAHPVSCVNSHMEAIHIHSKVMVIDDNYLRIGSTNLNHRSMAQDTECDVVIEAENDDTRTTIAAVRNDLIREHTGLELVDIERYIKGDRPPDVFLQELPHSRQHLRKLDDSNYRKEPFALMASNVFDSRTPLFTESGSVPAPTGRIFNLLCIITAIIALVLLWRVTPLSELTKPDIILPMLETLRDTPWIVPAAMGLYTLATLLFFPHMAMTAIIVIAFSPWQAFSIAMTGSLISGIIGFYAGHRIGISRLQTLLGDKVDKIAYYAKKGGIPGLTLLRMLPIAPYTAVNLALGMLKVSYLHFTVATFLGTLPGTAIASFLGFSLLELWQQPDPANMIAVGIGVALWLTVIAGTHLAVRHWEKHYRQRAPA